jgi:phosphotransferase system HPr (HPr) family protein
MQSTTIVVKNKVGLHARPASLFVKSAMSHNAAITVSKGEKSGNAKSILGILSLGVQQDDEITISADGPDEAQAIAALTELINDNFGEPVSG